MRTLNSAEMLVFGSNRIADMQRETNKIVKMLVSHVLDADVVSAQLASLGASKARVIGLMDWRLIGVNSHCHRGWELGVRCFYNEDCMGGAEYSTVDHKMRPESTQDVYESLPGFVDWMYEVFPDLKNSLQPYLKAAEAALAQE